MVKLAPLAEFAIESESPNSVLNSLTHLAINKFDSFRDQLNSNSKTEEFILKEYMDNSTEIRELASVNDISLTVSGNIHFNLSPIAAALQDVNISRIRKCEVCEKFFWAKQRNIYTCSKQHAKRRQMRLLRERWKENGNQYLAARNKRKEKNKEIKDE